ncbi:hypothetical protein HYFRA_00001708 [Hymenoscyphus fraxineus]|uniref:Uncharacterized protein n=1 Tax=Hymenoscyphus fraxineus TaxID=746836 RepID=A0A9N9L3V6_9HELO|nr:hypothetical protein HYFRA_00001708 [Hymenoscyphus fraxineus]
MAASNLAINLVVLGISGALSIPAFADFGKTPEDNVVTVNIGVGATNSSASFPDNSIKTPGGVVPTVELWDVVGNKMGTASSKDPVVEGGSLSLTMSGKDGGKTSTTPMYIRLTAQGTGELCISWLTTTSASSNNADSRYWIGQTAAFCGIPWYPSTTSFPTLQDVYQPPCFWMSNDGRFVQGFSARLPDFHYPQAEAANSTSQQWINNPETLCRAPGRQQFYSNVGVCIPMYPSGLSVVNEKTPEGFDVDFDAVMSSHTISCSAAGVPYDCKVDLSPGLPDNEKPCLGTNVPIVNNPTNTLAASITSELKSEIVLKVPIPAATQFPGAAKVGEDGRPKGGLASEIPRVPEKAKARRSAARSSMQQRRRSLDTDVELPRVTASVTTTNANPPVITEAPPPPASKIHPVEDIPVKKHAPVLNRREETRIEKPHEWCQENQLVVSEHAGHSATEVCESESSWGPDFVSVVEGIYCDMCHRRAYPLCGEKESRSCFDMDQKQIRASGNERRDGNIPQKSYEEVRHWK